MSLSFRMPLVWLLAAAFVVLSSCRNAPLSVGAIPAADLRADFADLYTSLQAAHFDLYVHRPKAEYDALYAQMRADIRAPLTRAEAEILFQEFVAYGCVAHANIAFPAAEWEAYRAGGGKSLPVSIRFIGDHLMIATDMSGGGLGGARILSLNGIAAADLESRLTAHLSADNAYLARTMLEFMILPLLWLELGPVDEFVLEIETPDGARRTVTLPALSRDTLAAAPESEVFELDWNERRYEIMGAVGYLRPGPFYDNRPGTADMWDTSAFTAFIDEAFTAFLAADVPAVLIDLRSNPGGDNSFSDHMVAWYADAPFRFASHFYVRVSAEAAASNARRLVPGDSQSISARFAAAFSQAAPGEIIDFDLGDSPPRAGQNYDGRVYLLIDRHSYSNTVTVAALSQDYGLATILGEETSDLASTYGAMEQFTLPRSGIEVNFPKAHIIRPGGDEASRGVVPDIAIASPLRPSSDEMLAAAIDHVRADIAGQ